MNTRRIVRVGGYAGVALPRRGFRLWCSNYVCQDAAGRARWGFLALSLRDAAVRAVWQRRGSSR